MSWHAHSHGQSLADWRCLVLFLVICCFSCNGLVAMGQGPNLTATFSHIFGFGLMYINTSAWLQVAEPADQCWPANRSPTDSSPITSEEVSILTTTFGGRAALFRAGCCHTGSVPAGDCFYGQRSVLAQLGGAAFVVIANCGSDPQLDGDYLNAPLPMSGPPLPLSIAPNLTSLTLPTISIGCDDWQTLVTMVVSGPVLLFLDSRGEIDEWTFTFVDENISTTQSPIVIAAIYSLVLIASMAMILISRWLYMCRLRSRVAPIPAPPTEPPSRNDTPRNDLPTDTSNNTLNNREAIPPQIPSPVL
jgi:hypothetical protein